ncbi:MAG: CHAP domain-containing protein [Clostridiales bacterium]|nr:CHAP domain-containing protein [Clostridiales bacterium]
MKKLVKMMLALGLAAGMLAAVSIPAHASPVKAIIGVPPLSTAWAFVEDQLGVLEPPKTPRKNESQLDAMMRVSQSQVGTITGLRYGGELPVSWCSRFTVWCARQAGIDSTVIRGSIFPAADNLLGNGAMGSAGSKYHDKKGYTPKRGDLVFFSYQTIKLPPDSFFCDHVGLVVKVEDGRVFTVEGNCNNRVLARSLPLGDSRIRGYGTPAYKPAQK